MRAHGGFAPTILAFAATLALAASAAAAPCGDDVEGVRLACRCGDTVVSSTRLTATDPVASQRCKLDGLTVHASAQAESLTLDLAGLAIQGSGSGVGVLVTYGGADGARILGGIAGARGLVTGFGTGVIATALESIANISHLEVRDNDDEGLRLAIAGTVLDDVAASGNGRDGIHLRGTGGRLIGVTSSDNGEHGIRVFSHRTVVEAEADRNGRSGVIVDGFGNDVSGAVAHDNKASGIIVRGRAIPPDTAKASGNSRDDVRVNGRRIAP